MQKDPKEIFNTPQKFVSFLEIMEKSLSDDRKELENLIFEEIQSYAHTHFKDDITMYSSIIKLSDLRLPHQWYPKTRLSKRIFYYHGGPTNSGIFILLSELIDQLIIFH